MEGTEAHPKTKVILDYIAEHSITEKLNTLVNKLCTARPADPWDFLAAEARKLAQPPTIDRLQGREILDSRGNPTVEVDVVCTVGGQSTVVARGQAPSGASTGSNEALELRDKDASRYLGKGVLHAVANVNDALSPALRGHSPLNLRECDEVLCKTDGTELKTRLGGNALTAASFAVAEAGAKLANKELFEYFAQAFYGDQQPAQFTLPTPMCNILNGGKHAGGNLKIQEFMIVPRRGLPFSEQLRFATTVYHHLGKLLGQKYGLSAKNLGDEGGFAPPLNNPEETIQTIEEAIRIAGFEVGRDIFIALDCASSEFYNEETKQYELEPNRWLTTDELIEYYVKLVNEHPAIISIEDGLAEKDYAGWIKLNAALGNRIQLVGDDLYTTNTNLITQGIQHHWANALLLKVNQIGTITESMNAARMLYDARQNVIVSHRSGETPNCTIADLAVGIGAQYIKTGAPARGERVAKYNRLLEIEEYLASQGRVKYE
eukprot:TRINITY_DN367_c0_g1_i3.p1 TRINITY_DN367_c0_g1~~TRINITY_DN367_c0_g1_i3.p1  ORF type:complete len:490 (-),score=239.30 TRINITY_DN367_c0_g1_i3:72-1541(-)